MVLTMRHSQEVKVYRVEWPEDNDCMCGECPYPHDCHSSLVVFEEEMSYPNVMDLVPSYQLCDCGGGRREAVRLLQGLHADYRADALLR